MREDGCTVVFDVGKTNAKLTLWDARGRCLERRVRRNDEVVYAARYRALDAQGLEAFLARALSEIRADRAYRQDHSCCARRGGGARAQLPALCRTDGL